MLLKLLFVSLYRIKVNTGGFFLPFYFLQGSNYEVVSDKRMIPGDETVFTISICWMV